MVSRLKRHSTLTNVKIVGEGYDEFGARYLKLKVIGSNCSLPPYSMEQILKPDQLHRDLTNAGASLFTKTAHRWLAEKFQNYKQQEASFSVVTRLGSFGRCYVRPDQIIGKPSKKVELALSSLDLHRCSTNTAAKDP